MGIFSYDNSNAGGGGPFNIFRGEADAQGQPVYHKQEYKDYTVPPAGQYRLKLTGFAEPQEVPISEMFRKPDGPTTKLETKLEFEIADGPGKGHKFVIAWVTFSLGDRSNAFQLYKAVMGFHSKDDAPQKRDWDDMIGKECMAFVTNPKIGEDGTPTRAGIAWDTVTPATAAGSSSYNPFASTSAA